ncbi:MAG: hypothetical protein HZY76_01675 [Anaerolineae bacterium]|nr:MAG: hypothetical protein HZY76_01675 [Anaerolineae bacterium]
MARKAKAARSTPPLENSLHDLALDALTLFGARVAPAARGSAGHADTGPGRTLR